MPLDQRSVGSHHLPSYLPATPFATTNSTGGAFPSPKHQSNVGGEMSSSNSTSYPLQSSSSGKSSSTTGRDQAHSYAQDYTARSSIGKRNNSSSFLYSDSINIHPLVEVKDTRRIPSLCCDHISLLFSCYYR